MNNKKFLIMELVKFENHCLHTDQLQLAELINNTIKVLKVGDKNVCDSDCNNSKDGKCNLDYLPVMLWTRDHKELSEVICDSYITTPKL